MAEEKGLASRFRYRHTDEIRARMDRDGRISVAWWVTKRMILAACRIVLRKKTGRAKQ